MKIIKKIFSGNETVTGDDFIDCTFNGSARATGDNFTRCTFNGSARATGDEFIGCTFSGSARATGKSFPSCTFNGSARATGNNFPGCTFSGSARAIGDDFPDCNFLGSFKGKKSNEANYSYSYSYNNYSENTNTNKNKFHFTNITCNSLNGGNYSGTINLLTNATNCTFETNSSIYGDNITYENCFFSSTSKLFGKNPKFLECTFKDKDATIKNCTFDDNSQNPSSSQSKTFETASNLKIINTNLELNDLWNTVKNSKDTTSENQNYKINCKSFKMWSPILSEKFLNWIKKTSLNSDETYVEITLKWLRKFDKQCLDFKHVKSEVNDDKFNHSSKTTLTLNKMDV